MYACRRCKCISSISRVLTHDDQETATENMRDVPGLAFEEWRPAESRETE